MGDPPLEPRSSFLKSRWGRYVLAVLVVLLGSLIRLVLEPYLGRSGFAVTLISMLVAAWVGGVGPCLVAQTLLLALTAAWFDQQKTPEESVAGKLVSLIAFYGVGLFVAVLSDFHRAALKRAESLRFQSELQGEHLRATLACMGDGVLVCDRFGRIVRMNAAAESLTGWEHVEALVHRLDEIFFVKFEGSSNLRENLVHEILREQRIIKSHEPKLLTTKNGLQVPISFSAAPIWDLNAEITGVVIVFRDETDRLRVEKALRDSDQRKDHFLATLAHELRNPLSPICMGVDLLKTCGDEPQKVREIQEMMKRQAQHMLRLIDDLLDISRITRGSLELRKSLVKLETIVQSAVEEVREQFDVVGHELIIDLPEDSPLFHADANRLTQVLSNLLNNAAKFTPPGGRIELTAKQHGDQLSIWIADNGVGLPADKLDSIFEMFTQVKQSLEVGHSGLGIGLTLVKQLVEMHGGHVSASSEGLQCGTKFQINLPLVAMSHAQTNGEHLQPQKLSPTNLRVLVVDDHPDGLKALGNVVRLLGSTAALAHDGLEAIEVGERFQPELIFMDLGMPRMNGYEAARHIRKTAWGREIPLVAITGWGQADDRQRTREAGFNQHLVKPVDFDTVQSILENASKTRVKDEHHVNELEIEQPEPEALSDSRTSIPRH